MHVLTVPSCHRAAIRLASVAAGLALVGLVGLIGPALPAYAATITVTTTADDTTPNDGTVSLREAITAINAGSGAGNTDIVNQNPGTFGTNDTINFNIAGA